MGAPLLAHLQVVAATGIVVALVVLMHYEGLLALGRRFARDRGLRRQAVQATAATGPGRQLMLSTFFGLIALHTLEIVVFGATFWSLMRLPGTGSIAGAQEATVFDAFYLSAMTYSTVGFGDLAPQGPIRWLAGAEALIGLMMVAWSASFAFMEMARHWRDDG